MIADLCFHPGSSRIAYFVTAVDGVWRKRRTDGWVGDLVMASAVRNEEIWRISLDAGLLGAPKGSVAEEHGDGYAARVLVSKTEVVSTEPGGWLLFFDVETGTFKRNVKVNGDFIYAIGLHPDGDKLRVATDRELQVIG